MTSKIHKLDWDSDFFELNIGELITNDATEVDATLYNLIIVKQTEDTVIDITNFEKGFQETKCIFAKTLIPSTNNTLKPVLNTDDHPLSGVLLYPLAYESGKYSRFKLDQKFTQAKFEAMYRKWVDNSLNKNFADKILYIKQNETIAGFVTLSKKDSFATIGLIAVSSACQGQGLGSTLLQHAERYCLSENINELRIPTQLSNEPACNFYSKNGYHIREQQIIKHYWNTI